MLPTSVLFSNTTLVSLGDDTEVLADFKLHAALPADVDWTEADPLLRRYLLSAELYVAEMSGQPYRQMEFTERFRWARKDSFIYLSLKRFPASDTEITMSADSGEVVYEEDTDYSLVDKRLIFPADFSCPSSTDPYPWTVTYKAGGAEDPRQLMAIFQLAAYYYRFPESVGKPVPDSVFTSHLDVVSGSFL